MTWLDVLGVAVKFLGFVAFVVFMGRAPASRLSQWQVFWITTPCFLLWLWLAQLLGPGAFLERPWHTFGLAPALSVMVGAACAGMVFWLRRRLAAEAARQAETLPARRDSAKA